MALHHQVLVLHPQLGKRPSLVPGERLALVLSSLLLGKGKLRETLLVVKPDTLVGWHRAIVRRHCRFLPRRKPGRPAGITSEMAQWVLQIGRENPWMGYGKIAGEMRKLGFSRFGRSSVKRILNQHGLTPQRRRNIGLGWLHFPGRYGRRSWEAIIEASVGKPRVWHGGTDARNVPRYAKAIPQSDEHPTLKPVPLLEEIIRAAAPSRGLMLDPFAGGGPTLIAAERTGRTCYAVELEPRYCDIIVARWEALTGSEARRLPEEPP